MKVMFVCVGNSCRSQMAEGYARAMGHEAASSGTVPTDAVHPTAIEVMQEDGIDIRGHTPKMLDFATAKDYDRVITMGCGVSESCPALRTDEDWGLEDPVGKDIGFFRGVRDEIKRRVAAL